MADMEDKAPDFNLEGMDGKRYSLKDFEDKYVILYFYPKDDTPGCTVEANEFTKHLLEIKKLGGEVVGISRDSIESHCKFRDKHDLKILLLSDPDNITIKKYNAYGDRGIFGVGTLRNTYIIKKGKVLKSFVKVNPKGHAEEIIKFLKSQK